MAAQNELDKALHIAKQIAQDHSHQSYGPAHIIKALLHKDFPLLRFLHSSDVDVYFIDEWADVHIESFPKRSGAQREIEANEEAMVVIDEADFIKDKLHREETDLLCMFIAAITPGIGFNYDQLKSLPVNHNELVDKFKKGGKVNTSSATEITTSSDTELAISSNDTLKKYTTDKIASAKAQKYEHIIGRDRELKKISEILSRKSKPNVIIQGEPGVGKSALIGNLASEIADQRIVSSLQNANILEIDTASLLSGASYKGEVEDRLKSIFTEAKAIEKPILFIDDFHTLLEDKSSSQGIANVIKSELNKGEVTVIGATTSDHYRKYIAADDALDRRFESVLLEEPDNDLAFRILKKVSTTYIEHHKLGIADDTLKEVVRMAKRYLKEKSLPDSAIDLIDRAMAATNVSKQSLPIEVEEIKEKLRAIESDAANTPEDKLLEEIDWLYVALKNKISPIVIEQYDTDNPLKFKEYSKKKAYITTLIDQIDAHTKKEHTEVSEADLAAMVSAITGIPAGKVQTQEQERLLNMEDTLKERVIGQDFAVKTVAEAIIESRSGLSKPGQPIGSFFFSGPTGTGKTELAKSLAEFLFNDESAIIRFDMSEFKEEHSAALLYGAPPGYVGYEEGGVLVNKIRQKPYSIVLFDEIEKAHQSVFDVFLQILDEGKLSDRLGKEGDFSNAVILFTSNIGSEFISKSMTSGKIPTSNELIDIMAGYFRPEFLGRITEIIPFSPITEGIATTIFNLHLKKELLTLTDRLGITVEIDEETRKHLSLDGFSPTYGVRPLKGVIRNRLKRPLSKMIISETIKAPQTVKVTIDDGQVIFTPITAETTPKEAIATDN